MGDSHSVRSCHVLHNVLEDGGHGLSACDVTEYAVVCRFMNTRAEAVVTVSRYWCAERTNPRVRPATGPTSKNSSRCLPSTQRRRDRARYKPAESTFKKSTVTDRSPIGKRSSIIIIEARPFSHGAT